MPRVRAEGLRRRTFASELPRLVQPLCPACVVKSLWPDDRWSEARFMSMREEATKSATVPSNERPGAKETCVVGATPAGILLLRMQGSARMMSE
jgi:hypothetical protein